MELAETHRQLLNLIKEFDGICSKNNINYTLHGGSLLGVIREQGFILWDDDIDTAMTRKEFLRLESLLQNNKKFYIYGSIKKQFRRRGDDSIWVDIFICDYIGCGLNRKIKLALLSALDIMNRNKNSIKLSNFKKYGKVKQTVFKILYGCGQVIPTVIKEKKYNIIAEKRFLGDKKRMHRSNDQYKGRGEDFPAEWMDEFQRVKFEDTTLLVLKKYHSMLVKCYGENYMTPIQDDRNVDVHDIVRGLGKDGTRL